MIAPAPLQALPQWVCYRNVWQPDRGKYTKKPVNSADGSPGSSTDSATWSEFQQAMEAVRRLRLDGVGFVLTEWDPFTVIDLDGCRNPETGEIAPWAMEIVRRLGSYTEVSPSGTGLHIILSGRLPVAGRRKGSIEVYYSGRYITVTGKALDGYDEIQERGQELVAWFTETFPEPAQETGARPFVALSLDDESVLQIATAASNGHSFMALYAGDTSRHGGDHSAADLALCEYLRFYTGGDREQIDRLFRNSGLMRPKWDERRGAQTYGERTLDKVLSSRGEIYNPARSEIHSDAHAGVYVTTDTSTDERIRILEEIVAKQGAEIAELKEIVTTQRARLQDMELEAQAYRNSHVGSVADILMDAAREVEWRVAAGRAEPDGSVHLPYDAIVTRRVGRDAPKDVRAAAKAAVTRAISKAAETNILDKWTEQRLVTRDEDTGEVFEEPQYRRRTYVMWGPDYRTMVESLAAATRPESAPKRGGWRPRCPKHPKAAVISTHRCSVCGDVLDPEGSTDAPERGDTNLFYREIEPTAPHACGETAPDDTNSSYIPTNPTVGNTNLYYRESLPVAPEVGDWDRLYQRAEAATPRAEPQGIRCNLGITGHVCPHPGRCSDAGRCAP